MPRKPKEVKANDGGNMSNDDARARVMVHTDKKSLNDVVKALSAPTPGPPDEGGLRLEMPEPDNGAPRRNVPLIHPEAGGDLANALRGYGAPVKKEKKEPEPEPEPVQVDWQSVVLAVAGAALGGYLLYKFVYRDSGSTATAAAAEVSTDVSYALPAE